MTPSAPWVPVDLLWWLACAFMAGVGTTCTVAGLAILAAMRGRRDHLEGS